jgi:alpha-galactosidase
MLFWKGADLARAQNLWRRWMLAHNVPQTAEGKPPTPIVFGNTSIEFNEMCNAHEENQKYFIDRYLGERVKLDFWWMDAGWYPCDAWPTVGTWEVDRERFPRGIRPGDEIRTYRDCWLLPL